jgi:hypothetical protein
MTGLWIPVLTVLAACILLAAGLTILGRRWRPAGVVGAAVTWLLLRLIPIAVAIVVVAWTGIWMFDLLVSSTTSDSEDAALWGLIAFFGVLVAGVLVIPLPGLISPHRTYRELLARCFALKWNEDGSVSRMPNADAAALSSLDPRDDGEKYPALIISAAANVTDVGMAPAGANVLPLEITASSFSIPTVADAAIATADLEQMKVPRPGYGLVSPRPMLGLSSAVAITGAAVSPAMGRLTQPGLRALLATMNVRLGAWMPNPLSAAAREQAHAGSADKFSVSIDQLLWEMAGRHSAAAMLLYASDGGHYENLALMPLLRRNCRTIWVVDSSPDRAGTCAGLGESFRLASEELDCEIDLDFDPFAERDDQGRSTTVSATGAIRYSDGTTGTLHVIRLGVTSAHSSGIRSYESKDRAFPFHSTIYQVFKGERVSSYRLLGIESARLAIAAAEQISQADQV